MQGDYRTMIQVCCIMWHSEWEYLAQIILKIKLLVYELLAIKEPFLYFGYVIEI